MSENQKTNNLQVSIKQELFNLRNVLRQQSFHNSSRLLDHETFIQRFKSKETPVTDAELIVAYKSNGSQPAFNELYKRYYSKMLRYVIVILKDEDEAKDVLQNAWMVVLASINDGSYLNVRQFDGWFKSTCYRLARQWKLENLRFMHGDENMPDKPDKSFNEEQRMIHAETETLLHKSLNGLDEEDRQVVLLRAWEGRSFHEIAVIRHLNVCTARSIYFRAVKNMRQFVSSKNVL